MYFLSGIYSLRFEFIDQIVQHFLSAAGRVTGSVVWCFSNGMTKTGKQ